MSSLFSYSKRSLILIFCFSIIQSLILFTYGHNWGSDYALYLEQSNALVDEWSTKDSRRTQPSDPVQQVDSNNPVRPMDRFMEKSNYYAQSGGPPATYPWGLSLLYAPVFALFGLDLVYYKILNVVLLQLFTLSVFLIRTETTLVKWWIYILLSCNTYLHHYTNNLVSDLPFLAFSTLSIILVHNLVNGFRARWLVYVLLILSLILSLHIRSNGILLFLPLIVYLGLLIIKIFQDPGSLKKTYKIDLIPISLVIVLVLLMNSWIQRSLPSNESNYVDFLMGFNLSTIGVNLLALLPALGDIYFVQTDQVSASFFTVPLVLLTLSIVVIGFKQDWKVYSLTILYLLATIGLYIIWPYEITLRFLFPILPFYFLFMVKGWFHIVESFNYQQYKNIPLILYIVYMTGITATIFFYQTYIYDSTKIGPTGEASQEVFEYLKHSSESDYILYNKLRDSGKIALYENMTTGFTEVFENQQFIVYQKQDHH